MTILENAKIVRPEVLEILDLIQRLREQSAAVFLGAPENQVLDFGALWSKIMEGNARWFAGENVSGLLTRPEQLFIARQHRFAVEYRAAALQSSHPTPDVHVGSADADGTAAEWQVVPEARPDRVVLYFHGGGYIMGSPSFMRILSVKIGRATRSRVLSVDYRLAPEHPFPAGQEDCVRSYRWLLASGLDPRRIVIAGDSAGGYYTLTTLLRIRDEGLPLPAGGLCLAPGTDLALAGRSYVTNGATDPVLADLGVFWWVEAYLAGADPRDPTVSPLYADLHGLPPLLIQVSASEMLLDDALMFAERAGEAGVDVALQIWDDTLHVFQQFDLPESAEALAGIGEFAHTLFGGR